MTLDFFQTLTIINSIVLTVLPIVFFRRQKLQEIKYNEIMELNIKTHDITQRADKSLKERGIINKDNYERLDYLISRYKKHSERLSKEIQEYKEMWDSALEKTKKGELNRNRTDEVVEHLLKKSEKIRALADKLLK